MNKGYFKYGLKNSAKVKTGLPYATHKDYITYSRPLCIVGDKIYVRDQNNQSSPLIVLDKNTLELLAEDQAVKNLKKNMKNLDEDDWNRPIFEVTDSDQLKDIINKSIRGSFRCLKKSPIFYDGTHILVISTHYVKNEADSEQVIFQTMEKFFVIEMYDPETMNYAGSIRLDLNIETQDEHISLNQTQLEDIEELKEHIYDERHPLVTLAHNKRNIIISFDKNMFVFDYTTGKRITDKIKLADHPLSFNIQTSEFWSIDFEANDFTLLTYKISGFGSKEERKSIQSLNDLFDTKTKEINDQMKEKTIVIPHRNTLNMLKGLSKNNTSHKISLEVQKQTKPINHTFASFSLLKKIFDGWKSFDISVKEYDNVDKNNTAEKFKHEKKFFRYPFCTSMSYQFFLQISDSLDFYQKIVGKGNNIEDVLIYYQFFSVFKLASCALDAVVKLKLSFNDIIQDKTHNFLFFVNLKAASTISTVTFWNISKPGQDGYDEEIYVIWNECQKIAQNVEFILLGLSSESTGNTLDVKIAEMIENLKEDKFTSSHAVFLKYLSLPSTMEDVLSDYNNESKNMKALELFGLIADKKVQKITDHISKLLKK